MSEKSSMSVREIQEMRLAGVARWATEIRRELDSVLARYPGQVHFRPTSDGVTLVGLLPERPQRGKGGFKNLAELRDSFGELFAHHCRDIPQGRVTPEKALQSWIISEAYRNERRLRGLNEASEMTDHPVQLVFVTDEVPIPGAHGSLVCDLLALRCDDGRATPVLIELKSSRQMRELTRQVTEYSVLMDEHREAFERLYSAVLGFDVRFDARTERWIVWPATGSGVEPREAELAALGIRVVSYEPAGEGFTFAVGEVDDSRGSVI